MSKSNERTRERSLKKKTAELVERHRPATEEVGQGAAAQLQDLRSWIEAQMHEEKLDEPDGAVSDFEPTAISKSSKSKTTKDGSTILSMKEAGVTSEK